MPFDILRTASFETNMASCLEAYSRSIPSVEAVIAGLLREPNQGNVYPGFGQVQVRKLRVALKEYRLSKRDGLRLIFMVVPKRAMLVPLMVYRKGQFKSEGDVNSAIKEQLRRVARELGPDPC